MLEGAKSMGAGAATIASAGAAVGIGNVFSSLIHSVARNPSLELFLTKAPFDAAEPWPLGFQDAATPMIQGRIDLHPDLFFLLILILVFVSRILVGPVLSKMERTQPAPLPTCPSTPSSSSNNNKKNKKRKKEEERKEPNYNILVEEFLNTLIRHLRVMHKEGYPSDAQPGHGRWRQVILEKLGQGLSMEERYDGLHAILSGLIDHNYRLRHAHSSDTFQELVSILHSQKGGRAR